MSVLVVPDDDPWPSLGPQVCEWIEANLCFGPGDLRGQPAIVDDEKWDLIYRAYEVYPEGHRNAGRRRFKRVAFSLAKGLAKTEMVAWLAAAELHHEAPVRCVGWHNGEPIGGPVTDPYIPMVAYTEEQSDELAYGALKAILEESEVRDDFDIGLERIMRVRGDGKAVSLSAAPNARDGARTTFQVADEPLAIDTPIPTPGGWVNMGALSPGDLVFDRTGKAVEVVGVSDIHHGRPCYRVMFDDGDSIVTDEVHRWKAIEWSNRPAGEVVVTTRDMLNRGVETGYGKRWRIPRNNGFDGVVTDLLIDPYFLGLWLGDGDSRNATISAGQADVFETRKLIEQCGYVVSDCRVKDGGAHVLYVTLKDSAFSGWAVANGGASGARSVVGYLRSLSVLGDKHIPRDYMRASRDQRLSLLQGLMDSDGHADKRGRCTFVQGRRDIAEQVCDLIRSLGCPARISERADHRARHGFMYKVHFSPQFCPFRLDRKADRCPDRAEVTTRWPAIVSIEPCESVPVRCIAVDSDDHLFLAGRGLRLTHNTHWWTLDKLKRAHQTMLANVPKRKLADAWAIEVTTAYEPGAGSVAETTMDYARAIAEGRHEDARLFFFHRQADEENELESEDDARAAVIQASGAAASWRDIDAIVELWRDPTTDRKFWERVWCNRPVQSARKAFDLPAYRALEVEQTIADGSLITLGFDGAQFRDATAIVATDVRSGHQWIAGVWECPSGTAGDKWQVPADEVDAVVDELFSRFNVWRMYADPPYWQSWLSTWQGRHGDERIIEWWTNRRRQMATALERFDTAIDEGSLSHSGDEVLVRHIGNAHRHDLPYRDEEARPLWLIRKDQADSPYKIDAAMAAVLSWEARADAIAAGFSGEAETVFSAESVKYWSTEPTGGNRYIVVYAANDKKPHPDTTVIWVLELREDRSYYVVDMVRAKLNLAERVDLLFDLHRKHDPLRVGYEKRGLEADKPHIEDRQKRENYRFRLEELGNSLTDNERVMRLVPLFEAGRVVLPEELKRDGVDLVQKFLKDELVPYPFGFHADMLDALSRVLDLRTEFPSGRVHKAPAVFPTDFA